MRDDDPNLASLREIAVALGGLRERVVFVGGSVAGLLVTDPVADVVRATVDVDAIVAVEGLPQFYRVEADLAKRGFARAQDDDVICRWRHQASGVLFDLMPTDPDVLGFANRWYPEAVRTSQRVTLSKGIEIRLLSAVAFVATKLEAFANRGSGDVLASHDLEDVLNLVDGRPELLSELAAATPALRDAVRAAVSELLQHRDFINGLPGLITDSDRAGTVLARLREMAV